MTNYNEIAQNNLDAIMQELAQYTRMAEEIAATVDSLKDILKKHMEKNGLDSIRNCRKRHQNDNHTAFLVCVKGV